MPNNTFPSTPVPSFSYVLDSEFRTITSDFESGEEARRTMWRFPKRTFALIYKLLALTAAERNMISSFFQYMRGSYESFWFFDFKERDWVDEYVGYGNNSGNTFDIPSKNTHNNTMVIYVAGNQNNNWTFSAGTGNANSDQITFTSVPANGALITADFKGQLRVIGRFKDDKLTEELFTVEFENISFSVYEVKTT